MNSVIMFDSTLRDGAQGENISFSAEDKLKIAQALDELGVGYIECGNPSSNPKDANFFRELAAHPLRQARAAAFGSTCRVGEKPENDPGVLTLLAAGTQAVSVFGKASVLHVEEVLRTTREENLRMIRETVAFLRQAGREVLFDAEHFFDGFRLDREYALDTLRAASTAGADWLILCDTNGGTLPDEIADTLRTAKAAVPGRYGIHCHNDCGLAAACSLAALGAGAEQIQGTLLGFGERCGNTNLSTVIGVLQGKRGVRCIPEEQLRRLTRTCAYIADVANLVPDNAMPFVGRSAFAHKGGMHVDGVLKSPETFEHLSPETVGNARTYLLSEQAGRSALHARLAPILPDLSRDAPELGRLLARMKEMEAEGYAYEAAGASFELLALQELGRWEPFFEVIRFRILGEQGMTSSAMVKVQVGDEFAITADEGFGPVNALDKALRKAVGQFYPALGEMRLTDFKVRVISPQDATAAVVRVLIESTDGRRSWTTVGVSVDIIHASLDALVDSIAYKLWVSDSGASGPRDRGRSEIRRDSDP